MKRGFWARLIPALLLLLGATLGVSSSRASASVINPGFDLWATAPGTQVDLTGVPGIVNPIVPLQGAPLPGLGDVDTIIERLNGAAPFPVAGAPAPIAIELVALSLTSVSPVDIGGTLFNMEIISGSLLGEPANPLGQMTVTHDFGNGGNFFVDSLPVDSKATFTEVGNPLNFFDVFIPVVFVGAVGQWAHTPGPLDPHDDIEFPAGDFFAGIDPFTREKLPPISHPAGPGFPPGHIHVVRAGNIPAPGTLALLGIAGLMGARRRRR